MRRKIALVALLGGLASGLGCVCHIAGKNDCGYNPADYPIGQPTPPYPSALAPSVPATKTPDKIPNSIFKTGGETVGDSDSVKPAEPLALPPVVTLPY